MLIVYGYIIALIKVYLVNKNKFLLKYKVLL